MATHDPLHLRADPGDRTDLGPPAGGARRRIGAIAVLAVVAAAGWWWWTDRMAPGVEQAQLRVPPQEAPAPATAAPPAVLHPLPPATDSEPLQAAGITPALADLLGAQAVAKFLQTDAFARRFAATVDNLGRDHAPVASWPLLPTPGRFTVEERADGAVIAPDNASRYTPLVMLAGTVDAARAVQLYRRMYPLLQQAYRGLGFGDRYLNDRVVEVIDVLLKTPEPNEPLRVQLTQVKGPIPSVQPWTRYEFADAALERLTAGQKILLRIGPENERRLKQKLRELRRQLVAGGPVPSGGR